MFRLSFIALFLLGGSPFHLSSAASAEAFHPSDLDGLVFFVESTHGLNVARCASLDCFDAGENAPLERQYCDLESFPDGCVRRWEDQSAYVPSRGFDPPEHVRGRDFGQDDHDKPGIVLDCLNGRPCVRGGRGAVQELSLETEPKQEVGPIQGPFSVFLLARPVEQEDDFVYFGFAGTELTHLVDDDSLKLRIDFRRPTVLTEPGAVSVGNWHLIELHRDAAGRVRAMVDGWDHTVGAPMLSGRFFFRFLLSVSRGRAMHGDVAALLIYDAHLGAEQKGRVRSYLAENYGLRFGDGSPPPRDEEGVDLETNLLLHWPLDGCDAAAIAGPRPRIVPRCGRGGPEPIRGRLDGALAFGGGSHGVRSASPHPELDQLFRFTVAAWVRPRNEAGDWRSVVDKRDGPEDGWDLYLTPEGRAFLRIDDLQLKGDRSLLDGAWHHVAGVYDGNHLRLYVDGRLDRSRFVSRTVSLGTDGPVWVGRHFDNDDSSFVGAVDDVRIYGRALSAPEVRALAEFATDPETSRGQKRKPASP